MPNHISFSTSAGVTSASSCFSKARTIRTFGSAWESAAKTLVSRRNVGIDRSEPNLTARRWAFREDGDVQPSWPSSWPCTRRAVSDARLGIKNTAVNGSVGVRRPVSAAAHPDCRLLLRFGGELVAVFLDHLVLLLPRHDGVL